MASHLASSEVPIASGLAPQLRGLFPSEPSLAVERAVSDGLLRALDDEGIPASEVTCNRDYSRLCPEGWADAGDGSTCVQPLGNQGPCGQEVAFGGSTPLQKRRQAAKCGASFPCLGACAPDASSSCPLGWAEDVEPGVCLSPAGYSGPCVQRKSFLGMGARDRELWAKSCEVTWPCRQKLLSDLESAGPIARGAFKSDCVTDYSGPCPDRHTLKDGLCEAPADFLGRCGFTLSSQHSTAEKVAYAEVCLTPWPCRVAAA